MWDKYASSLAFVFGWGSLKGVHWQRSLWEQQISSSHGISTEEGFHIHNQECLHQACFCPKWLHSLRIQDGPGGPRCPVKTAPISHSACGHPKQHLQQSREVAFSWWKSHLGKRQCWVAEGRDFHALGSEGWRAQSWHGEAASDVCTREISVPYLHPGLHGKFAPTPVQQEGWLASHGSHGGSRTMMLVSFIWKVMVLL